MVIEENLKLLLALPQHPWLSSAIQIENSWDALAAISEDADCLLEPEDFENDPTWLTANVPIQWKTPAPSALETPGEWDERLSSLRSMLVKDIPPIIVFMDSSGTLEIIDGYHRVALFIERGQSFIPALVRCAKK